MKQKSIARVLVAVTPILVVCCLLASSNSAMAESHERSCSNRTLFGDYGSVSEGVLLEYPRSTARSPVPRSNHDPFRRQGKSVMGGAYGYQRYAAGARLDRGNRDLFRKPELHRYSCRQHTKQSCSVEPGLCGDQTRKRTAYRARHRRDPRRLRESRLVATRSVGTGCPGKGPVPNICPHKELRTKSDR